MEEEREAARTLSEEGNISSDSWINMTSDTQRDTSLDHNISADNECHI